LGGAVASDESLKQLHQTLDSVAVCKPITKFSAAVGASHMVAEVVSNAFRAAETAKVGDKLVSTQFVNSIIAATGRRASDRRGTRRRSRRGPAAYVRRVANSGPLNAQITRHLFVHFAGGDKKHHFSLSRRQRGERFAETDDGCLCVAAHPITPNGRSNSVKHRNPRLPLSLPAPT
jgi:hypothetical protein